MPADVVLSWSGGKDSAMALHEIRTNPRYARYRVRGLLTTFTEGYDRVSGHGVRRELIERQAAALKLDLYPMYIPQSSTMRQYETRLHEAFRVHRKLDTTIAAFGDIFLKDVKKRRIDSLGLLEMRSLFPLWRRSTKRLIQEFIDGEWEAYVVCVDSEVLDRSFVGRRIDHSFVTDLPEDVDPCGENGEYHSFVVDGPVFARPVACELSETVSRDDFHYQELIPVRPVDAASQSAI
jgi:uncharacterized protein (TIGR00290 family)